MINSRSIDDMRPDAAANCRVFIYLMSLAGFRVGISNTRRDNEAQANLYAQGRTRPGKIVTNSKITTYHGAGLAFDIYQAGVPADQAYSHQAFWDAAGRIGKQIGFSWGHDWSSFPEGCHFQWDDHGRFKGADIIAGRLPPEMPLYITEDEELIRYKTINDVPAAYKPELQELINMGVIKGSAAGLDLTEDMIRIAIYSLRLFKKINPLADPEGKRELYCFNGLISRNRVFLCDSGIYSYEVRQFLKCLLCFFQGFISAWVCIPRLPITNTILNDVHHTRLRISRFNVDSLMPVIASTWL